MKEKLLKMTMGEHLKIKVLLSTKEVIRLNEDEWQINCFVDGCCAYYYNLTEVIQFFNNLKK
tara:strand:+ start:98 stop:283 length:186 start_codon:yes stop_codon:yes gene_type:complete